MKIIRDSRVAGLSLFIIKIIERRKFVKLMLRRNAMTAQKNNQRIIRLFDGLQFCVSEDDWKFMCQNRFFSDDPPEDEIQAEFVTGTGITKSKKDLWSQASSRFAEYVEDLRDICGLDVNAMARAALTDKEKFV